MRGFPKPNFPVKMENGLYHWKSATPSLPVMPVGWSFVFNVETALNE